MLHPFTFDLDLSPLTPEQEAEARAHLADADPDPSPAGAPLPDVLARLLMFAPAWLLARDYVHGWVVADAQAPEPDAFPVAIVDESGAVADRYATEEEAAGQLDAYPAGHQVERVTDPSDPPVPDGPHDTWCARGPLPHHGACIWD